MAGPEDYSDLAVAAPAKEDYSDLAQPAETGVSPAPEETHSAYIPDHDAHLEYPASMSHDQVNDAAQTGVFGRPRNLSFNPQPPALADAARDIITGNISGLAARFGEQAGASEPQLVPEAGKAAVRMAESLPKGVSGLLDMMGQNLEDQAKLSDPKYQSNLAYTVGKGMEQIGKTAFEFYKDRGENGFEAPDPEVFRGSFMSNPSVTRLVSGIIENVPLVAATAAASASTGGAAPLVLFGGMSAGESFESSKAQGSDTARATGTAELSGFGNALLMSLPIEGYIAKITKGVLPEVALKSASFTALGGLMTPFNNITAKIGGEKSRKLFEGMTESLVTMAASGFILGGIAPGRGGEIDRMIADAQKNGVAPKDIDAAREVIAKQIQKNPEAVTEALLSHSEKTMAPAAEEAAKGPMTPEDIESKRGEIVKTIADSLRAGEGVPEAFQDHADLIHEALAQNKSAQEKEDFGKNSESADFQDFVRNSMRESLKDAANDPERLAEAKRKFKATERRETLIDSISEKYMAGEKPAADNVSPDILNEAKQRVIDKINELEDSDGKIRNRYQDLRYRLTKELKEYSDSVESSTEQTNQAIQDRATKEQELKTEYDKKTQEYKALYGEPTADEIASVDGPAKSQAQAEFIREISQGRESQKADRVVKLKTGEPREGVAPGPIEGGEREGKSKGFEKFKAGLEKSVRDRIEQHAELSGSFGHMDAAEDAAKGIKFVEEQPERARRVALGLEAPPAGVSDVAVSGAYAEKMKRDGNVVEQARAEMALSLRGTRQGQELAARAYRVGDNSPEQFIQKVIRARQEMAGKKLFSYDDATGKKDSKIKSAQKTIEKESSGLADRLKAKSLDLEAAQKLLDEIKC